MAYASILRKSASSLLPLAARAARVRRNHFAPISAALNRTFVPEKPSPSSFSRSRDFSSDLDLKKPKSDESLLQIIESEIQCAVESEETDPVESVPSGFPFKIEDEPGLQMITLTREYNGETIKVEVHMPNLVTGEDDEDRDDDDNEKANQSSIPLAVTVTKRSGLTLEFNCVAFPDEVSIESLSFRNSESEDQLGYEGPEFEELDENLQKAFHKYLEIRGIKPSTTNFLHEYMVNKDSREYLMWLKNLKKFIQE